MCKQRSVIRRCFLKSTGSAAAGLATLGRRAGAVAPPSETIRVGCIGVGGMGTGRLKQFMREKDCDVVAVCDVDRNHLQRAASIVEEGSERKPSVYEDFRELLDRDDLDAVTVTTPDHWHALPFVSACETKKDVFVEKPLSHSLYEGRKMVEAAREYKCMSQMGNHIHSGRNYRRVVQIVRSGILGEITRLHVWRTSGLKSLGRPADTAAPESIDYNFWLGPAPKRPYNPLRCHRMYRHFWDYSGGTFADFWCHISDIAYWALGLKAPGTVAATGGRRFVNDIAEAPNTLEVIYDYGGIPMLFTLNPTAIPGFPHMGGIGCMIQGRRGTVVTNYNTHEVYIDNKKIERPDLGETPEPEPSPGHVRQFLDSIKSRQLPDCNVEYAHTLTKGMHLGLIAFRTDEHLRWDDEKERFVGNSRANRLLKRRYRRPWKL